MYKASFTSRDLVVIVGSLSYFLLPVHTILLVYGSDSTCNIREVSRLDGKRRG